MGLVYAAKHYGRRATPADTVSCGSAQVWGENLFYSAAGSAEAKPTMLFLHESGGSSTTWQAQLVGLARVARCLVVDLPGHGRSEGTGFPSVPAYREAVLAFLDALAIRWPVVLAGVCLGAAIALDIALHAPERVAGLVMAGVNDGGRASDRIRRLTAMGEAPDAFVYGLFGLTAAPGAVNERLQRWRLTSPLVRHGDLTAVREYGMRLSLLRLSHPTLAVVGEQDPIATEEVTRDLLRGKAGARVVTLPRAGCMSMVEQPVLFNREVERFLTELGPGCCSPGKEESYHTGYRRF